MYRFLKTPLLATIFLFGSLASPLLTAASTPNELFFEKIENLKTLKGQFKQTIVDDQGESLQDSAGEFAIARPGLFRWETNDPYTQLLVANKKIMWLYDPELEQVTEKRFDESNSNTPIWLLTADLETIKNDYNIKKLADDKATIFELIPVDEEYFFKTLTITFVDKQLSAMTIIDNIDQTTEITFTISSKNKDLPSNLFTFDIPEGVDVIYDK